MNAAVAKPAPLVPAEVDLRDFPYTPILRSRLRGSTFNAITNDSEWRAGMTLWLNSWDQVPAGSLPVDDPTLCRLAELAREVQRWKKLRKNALHGWIECSDGRLYHKVVAKVVLEAWIEKLASQLSAGAGNAKRWGTDWNPEPIEAMIETARRMLLAVDPMSKILRKKRGSTGPSGSGNGQSGHGAQGGKKHPVGNPGGHANGHASGIPSGIPSGSQYEFEVNRKLIKSDSGVDVASVAGHNAPSPENGAIEKSEGREKHGSGQQWQSEAWVIATSVRLDCPRRQNESFADFKDRVHEAVRRRMQ